VFLAGGLASIVVTLLVVIWWDTTRPVTVLIVDDPGATITVQLEGAVMQPGTLTLPAGSRLQDAVTAAGGFRDDADTTTLYLAARLGDGERIVIPAVGDAVVTTATIDPDVPSTGENAEPHLVVSLNRATVEELDALPGIGEVLAGRIVAYRDAHGPFQSIDELTSVEGIGPTLLEELRPYLTLDQ